MIAEQEELDWDVYGRYGLLSESEAAAVVILDPATVPELNLGERAFEIVLAAGETDSQWFARHGSSPITELPGHWPAVYRRVVQARIGLIKNRRDLALIERPECKRRWAAEDWESQQERAIREWLLDRLEAECLWFAEDDLGVRQPIPRSVAEVADLVRPDAEFNSVAALWAADALGRPDADTAEIVAALVDEEHVPFLAAYRYKGRGHANRAVWERVWDMQCAEDDIAAELGHEVTDPDVRRVVEDKLGRIPVPPKYSSAEFARASYWRHRGKLDVPKERFISYPGVSRDGDGSLLLGWAGWDHREQAHALAVTITHRRTEAGWGADRIRPLLAGLAEVLPWVRQWHTEIDPAYGTSPAEAYDGFLDAQLAEFDLSLADLRGWAPNGRVDVSPLPGRRTSATDERQPREPRDAAPDPGQRDAVLEFAAGGPITTGQVADLLGVGQPQARALVRKMVEAGSWCSPGSDVARGITCLVTACLSNGRRCGRIPSGERRRGGEGHVTSAGTAGAQPLLRELIKIPERFHKGDFVLKLVEGVAHRKATLASYVVTPQLKVAFDEALGLVGAALAENSSKASYVHGSFGSGKSHFMAVLHALLDRDVDALEHPDLVGVAGRHPWLAEKRLLLVPYHVTASGTVEAGILGGYVDHIRKMHPEARLPQVYRTQGMIEDAKALYRELGAKRFLARLVEETPAAGGNWGELEDGWTAELLGDAFAADPDSALAGRLVSEVVPVFLPGYASSVAGAAGVFKPIDTGLVAISQHARDLGYDGLMLFLDELVLWLAGRIGRPDFIARETDKVAKLVESADSGRPVPIISLIARQRDLRELALGRNGPVPSCRPCTTGSTTGTGGLARSLWRTGTYG